MGLRRYSTNRGPNPSESLECVPSRPPVFYLARDPRRPDDLESRGPDHAADACRYALGAEKPRFTAAPISGVHG